jgi:DNA sulfur modification protein DndC
MSHVLDASHHVRETLQAQSNLHWMIAYSGGKDSSALLCLVFNNLLKIKPSRAPSIEVLYCDTKTENPIIDTFAKRFLRRFRDEARESGFRAAVKVISPASDRTYFARVIGRGYPPPTNSFRWCTKELRIRPVERYLARFGENAVVALGVRQNESLQRDRMLSSHRDPYWMVAENTTVAVQRKYYTPIRQLSTEDVWDVIFFSDRPIALDRNALWTLYSSAGGDCPIIRSPDSAPCASGRFGCWTCTVVRRDRSGESLLNNGYTQMADFLRFRTLLLDIRNDEAMRWPIRRKGTKGLGPLTVAARQLLLTALRKIERKHSIRLLSERELRYISEQWCADRAFERKVGIR